ncbi:MAG: FitA-like ribbon-helix-helix domain-containing protein [Limisphaerales bacterium]
MSNILLKDIPEGLHEQLEREAAAHSRSLDQEALARLQRSFDLEAAFNTERDQHWIDEALASGSAEPKTQADWDALKERVLGHSRK